MDEGRGGVQGAFTLHMRVFWIMGIVNCIRRKHGGSEELRRLVELRGACAVPEAVQRASVTPAGAKRWNSPWIRVSV